MNIYVNVNTTCTTVCMEDTTLTSCTFPSLSINFIIGSRPLTYLIWRLGNFAGRSLLTNAEKQKD